MEWNEYIIKEKNEIKLSCLNILKEMNGNESF